jgi:hypothetical protein
MLSLRADCEHCFGLCCVAPAFFASADFAIDKSAGQPYPNLPADFRWAIHHRLRQQGFAGCTTYDCFGAGQKVAQITFAVQDWRQTPRIAAKMFNVFTIMRQLHELLWLLTEACHYNRLDRCMRSFVLRSTRPNASRLAAPKRCWRWT